MLIDVVNAGWVPIYNVNLSEDVPGYMAAPATALSYPWTRLISGPLGRLATRDDVAVHQQYIADIDASAREALESVEVGARFLLCDNMSAQELREVPGDGGLPIVGKRVVVAGSGPLLLASH